MKPNPVHRLPAPLESAVQRLKLAAREAAERTIESLGLAALASTSAFQRDGLLGAQFELNRKSAVFVLTFNDAFDERLLREVGPAAAKEPVPAAPSAPTSWDALSLVEDSEMEAQISADRFGMEIAHGCEWELRELDAYVGSLLADAGGASERNPLRPDLIGHAMMRGIGAVSDRAEIRKVLAAEMSRSLSSLLPAAYAAAVADLRHAGVQPLGLAVRNRPVRAGGGEAPGRDAGSLGYTPDEQVPGSPWPGAAGRGPAPQGGAERGPGARRSGGGGGGGVGGGGGGGGGALTGRPRDRDSPAPVAARPSARSTRR